MCCFICYQPDFTHFDRRLGELTEKKNNLSYENGKLHAQVEQLKEQLDSHKQEQEKYDKTNKRLLQAENKLKKVRAVG